MERNIDKYKTFFFDFDGVIVDSLYIKAQAFGELFSDYGEDIVKKVMDYHLNNGGVSRYEKFKYYYRNLLKKEITQKMIEGLDRRYSQIVTEKVAQAPFIKGVINFIRKLNENRKECFIVSATPQQEIKNIAKLKGIEKFFKEIAGSPKPKDRNLEYLVKQHSVNPDRAIYFGDAKSDYEAAGKQKIKFIGINYLNGKIGYKDFDEFVRREEF